MSVDSVDRSSQFDSRRASEEHEKEVITRHRKEISDLQKRHQKDVENIRKDYQDAMSDLRHGTTQALSEKEQRHVKDVQGIQEMNRKHLARQKGEDEEKYDTTKNTLQGELNQAKAKDVTDQKRLTKEFDGALDDKDEEESQLEKKYREGSHEAYETQGNRLRSKAEEDQAKLRDEMHQAIAKKDMELTETRRNRDQAVGGLKTRIEDQRKALSERYKDNLRREQDNYSEHLANLEDGFQNSIGQTKQKYKNRTEELSDQYSKNFDKLKDSTNDRTDKQIDSVRRENQALQDKLVLTKEKDKIQHSIETDHLVGEYQNKYDELETRRQMAAQMAHKEKTKDIEHIIQVHGREDLRRNTQFANRLNEQKNQGDVYLEQKVGQVEQQRDMIKLQTDVQKKRVVDTYADKTNDQAEFFDDQMNSRQLNYEKMLGEQRGVWEKQKGSDLTGLQNQMAKENIAHQEKLMDTISNYEKQLATTKNEYEKKLRHQADLFRDQTDKQVKAMQVDRETSESKLKDRMALQKENFERELDQLRKRQMSERQELAMRKT
jgi:hypothetical protein